MDPDREARDKRRLFVGGITGRTKMEKIQNVFSKFGNIVDIKRPRNDKGAFRGFCFIEYETEESIAKALSSGNLWYNDRLLSLRKLKSTPQLQTNSSLRDKQRITIYGFPKILTSEIKEALQKYFSMLGQLEYFYYMYVRIDKIENDEIQEYVKVNNLQTQEFQKIHILNISYKNVNISKSLLSKKDLTIAGETFKVSRFTRKLKQEEIEAKKSTKKKVVTVEQPVFDADSRLKASLVLQNSSQNISPNSLGRVSQNMPSFQQFYSPQIASYTRMASAPLPWNNTNRVQMDQFFKIRSMDCIGQISSVPQNLRNHNNDLVPRPQNNAMNNSGRAALDSYLAQKQILSRNKIMLEVVVPYSNFNHNISNLKFNHIFYD